MTREERLDWLCRLRSEIYVYMPYEWLKPMDEALTDSIKALEQKPMIFKSSTLDTEYLEQCRQRIKEQIEEGVVLLPYYIDLISPQEGKTEFEKVEGDK